MPTVRLLESGSDATLWTNRSSAKKSVAPIGLNHNGPAGISIIDPEAKYGKLIRRLVYACTNDFSRLMRIKRCTNNARFWGAPILR